VSDLTTVKKKKKALPNSFLVTQSNQLVEARYNLPLVEQRLILTMISRIQPGDEDFKPYRISVSDLADFLGIDKSSAYRECKKTTENLLTRVINIEEGDGLLQVGWVSSAKYIDGTGMVNLSFDPSLKPYLLKLKGNFTSSRLEMLLSFKSQYTMRIYNLLKQYERLREREMELDQLKEVLGIRKDQYQMYGDFRRSILLGTQKELNEKADLSFEFEEIKYGRKVGAIRFKIITKNILRLASDKKGEDQSPKQPPIEGELSPPPDDLVLLVPETHRTKKTVLSAIESAKKKHNEDYIRRNILYSNAKATKSYASFLNTALKEDWGHDWDLDQQTATKKKTIEIWERQGFPTEAVYDEFMYQKRMKDYGGNT